MPPCPHRLHALSEKSERCGFYRTALRIPPLSLSAELSIEFPDQLNISTCFQSEMLLS